MSSTRFVSRSKSHWVNSHINSSFSNSLIDHNNNSKGHSGIHDRHSKTKPLWMQMWPCSLVVKTRLTAAVAPEINSLGHLINTTSLKLITFMEQAPMAVKEVPVAVILLLVRPDMHPHQPILPSRLPSRLRPSLVNCKPNSRKRAKPKRITLSPRWTNEPNNRTGLQASVPTSHLSRQIRTFPHHLPRHPLLHNLHASFEIAQALPNSISMAFRQRYHSGPSCPIHTLPALISVPVHSWTLPPTRTLVLLFSCNISSRHSIVSAKRRTV